MSEVESVVGEIDLPCSVETVWAILSDFGNAPRYVAGVGKITVTGAGIGMVRRVPFESSWTDEKLEAMDHANHRFVYTTSAWSDDVNFYDYRSEVQVTPLTESTCHYRREGRYKVKPGVTPQSVRDILTRAYAISMNSLADMLRKHARG